MLGVLTGPAVRVALILAMVLGPLTYIRALRAERDDLRARVAHQLATIEQAEAAYAAEHARAQAEAKARAALSAEIETLMNGGIPDAPLHPDLVRLLGSDRLRSGTGLAEPESAGGHP